MVVSLAEKVTHFTVSFRSAKVVIVQVSQKHHHSLTGQCDLCQEKTEVYSILPTLRRFERGGYIIRQSTNGPSHPRKSVGH